MDAFLGSEERARTMDCVSAFAKFGTGTVKLPAGVCIVLSTEVIANTDPSGPESGPLGLNIRKHRRPNSSSRILIISFVLYGFSGLVSS